MRPGTWRALSRPKVGDVRAHELRRILANQDAVRVEKPQAHRAHEEGAGLERREAGRDVAITSPGPTTPTPHLAKLVSLGYVVVTAKGPVVTGDGLIRITESE